MDFILFRGMQDLRLLIWLRDMHLKKAVENRQKRPFSEDVLDWLPLGWLRDLHLFFVLASISKKFDWKL